MRFRSRGVHRTDDGWLFCDGGTEHLWKHVLRELSLLVAQLHHTRGVQLRENHLPAASGEPLKETHPPPLQDADALPSQSPGRLAAKDGGFPVESERQNGR